MRGNPRWEEQAEERSPEIQGDGASVTAGTCIECSKEIIMTAKEYKWWQDLVAKKEREGENFSMPKRCPECRAKRKSAKESSKVSNSTNPTVGDVAEEIRALSEEFVTSNMTDEVLYSRLQEIADKLDNVS
jgi:ssDNA-binding Zn-finger/Zn-ribbon topoisomerase 1